MLRDRTPAAVDHNRSVYARLLSGQAFVLEGSDIASGAPRPRVEFLLGGDRAGGQESLGSGRRSAVAFLMPRPMGRLQASSMGFGGWWHDEQRRRTSCRLMEVTTLCDM
jgi:hypothetical protein